MSGVITTLEALFQPEAPNPAVAAATMVLSSVPPPLPPGCLDAALRAVAPLLTEAERSAWIQALGKPLLQAGITSARCVAAFLGQCSVESAGFHALEEDLNYSAERLCKVWPARFPSIEAASACAMQPEKLANIVYADRMGNGDAASGDGWRYRGRGLIQLTGRAIYARFAAAMRMSLDEAVAHAATVQGAADSAAWFWSAHELTLLANTWSLPLITRRINGGTEGEAERARRCEAALQAIGAYSCSLH